MRVLRPQSKCLRLLPIPAELQSDLGEVHELIEESLRDSDVNLDFDDAIQTAGVCGGRYGKAKRPYVLTYYPTDDRQFGRWFLTLHELEIEDIADGCMTDILMHCCTSPDCRSKFREAGEHCFYCDYVDDPRYGVFAFPGALEILQERGIADVTASSTRSDLETLLGKPDRSGGDVRSKALGFIRPWINYRRADCQLRFEFNAEERVATLTVMERDWEPGQ